MGRAGPKTLYRNRDHTSRVSEGFDFHRAEIVIDDELNIPIHYAAYDFPETPGGKPRLLEQYTYREVDLDANLTEEDFQRSNLTQLLMPPNRLINLLLPSTQSLHCSPTTQTPETDLSSPVPLDTQSHTGILRRNFPKPR